MSGEMTVLLMLASLDTIWLAMLMYDVLRIRQWIERQESEKVQ